jgi:hypothetical protein
MGDPVLPDSDCYVHSMPDLFCGPVGQQTLTIWGIQ